MQRLVQGADERPAQVRIGSFASAHHTSAYLPDAAQSLWRVRALDFQGMRKSSAMRQEPAHAIRPASCRCRPIAVEFPPPTPRRGLLLSELMLQAFYAENSHTERSPLDSTQSAAVDQIRKFLSVLSPNAPEFGSSFPVVPMTRSPCRVRLSIYRDSRHSPVGPIYLRFSLGLD
jgi:hypothetical protein